MGRRSGHCSPGSKFPSPGPHKIVASDDYRERLHCWKDRDRDSSFVNRRARVCRHAQRAALDCRDRQCSCSLQRRRVDGASRSQCDGKADPFSRRAAGVVESPRGANRWRRNQRRYSESHWRTACSEGFAAYGSDSGHQNPPAERAALPNPAASDWWFNDEAIRNFGYMQMKKTHDAAMVIIERMYGERPRIQLLHRQFAGRT